MNEPKNEQPLSPKSSGLSSNCWKWAIIVVYGLAILAIIPFHEPGQDEAHTWLIARDLSYKGIIHQMRYEGYPPLWFLLQAPLAKAGLPYASLGVLNAFCATLAVAVMVFFSPFSLWQKVLIAFSDCLFCGYGMVWRCYSLGVLTLFVIAAVYPVRHRRPLLYALSVLLFANVHVLTLGTALLLFLGFIAGLTRQRHKQFIELDRRSPARISVPINLLACGIMGAGITLIILIMRQPPDHDLPGLFPLFQPNAPFRFLTIAFDRLQFSPGFSFYVLSILAFILLLWDLWRTRGAFWLLLLTFLGWSYVFTFKNAGPFLQHGTLLMIMMVVACWIARVSERATADTEIQVRREKREWHSKLPIREIIVFGSLLYGFLNVPFWIYLEIRYPFSAAKETAMFLRKISPSQPIVAYPLTYTGSLLPYLPGRRFWSLEMNQFETFYTPCQQFAAFNVQTGVTIPVFPSGRPWIVIGGLGETHLDVPDYELVYPSSPKPAWNISKEYFWIYRPKDEKASH